MLLIDNDLRSYSYFIDASVDGVQFKRLIDCSAHHCRSWQFLHFPSRPVQYIKLVGIRATNTSTNDIRYLTWHDGTKFGGCYSTFDVVGFKAIYIESQDMANYKEPGILRSVNNVANPKMGAMVIEGVGGNNMLNENIDEYTWHETNQGCILLQLNQPYYISSLRMLLGCDKNHIRFQNKYSFYIQTSFDQEKWQMAVDKCNESLSGWQQFEFEERVVVFVKIVGTEANIVSTVLFF